MLLHCNGNDKSNNNRNCSGNHGLKQFNTPSAGYGCDLCKKSVALNAEMASQSIAMIHVEHGASIG